MTFIIGLDLSSAYRIAGRRLMGHRRQSDAALWYVGPLRFCGRGRLGPAEIQDRSPGHAVHRLDAHRVAHHRPEAQHRTPRRQAAKRRGSGGRNTAAASIAPIRGRRAKIDNQPDQT